MGYLVLILLATGFLAWVVRIWLKRKQLTKHIDSYNCVLCDSPLDEALYEFLGYVSKEEKAQLDKFQAQYVHCKIRCGNCAGILICADNGTPMRGYYEEGTL